MPRLRPIQNVFFRHKGAEDHTVYWRIRPTAIRWQQATKGSVVETLGGYYQEILYSEEPQYRGLMLPDLVIEGDTGVSYLHEVKRIDWIFRHQGDLKDDGTLAETWFYFLTQPDNPITLLRKGIKGVQEAIDATQTFEWLLGKNQNPFLKTVNLTRWAYSRIEQGIINDDNALNGVPRFAPRIYRIHINSFSYDDSVNDPYRIRFSFRCKVLWESEDSWEYVPQSGQRSLFALLGLGTASQWVKPALNAAAQLFLLEANGQRMGITRDRAREVYQQIYGTNQQRVQGYLRRGDSVFGQDTRRSASGNYQSTQAAIATLNRELAETQARQIQADPPPLLTATGKAVRNPTDGTLATLPTVDTVIQERPGQTYAERYLQALGIYRGDRYNTVAISRPATREPSFGGQYQAPNYATPNIPNQSLAAYRYAPPIL